MNSRDFVFWLQGFFELSAVGNVTGTDKCVPINNRQSKVIQDHLNLVFVHEIDPAMGNQAHQDKLNDIHNGDSQSTTIYVNGKPAGIANPLYPKSGLTPEKVKELLEEGDELQDKLKEKADKVQGVNYHSYQTASTDHLIRC